MRSSLTFAGLLAAGAFLTTPAAAQTLEEALASASVEEGESLFRQCKACHTIEAGGPNRVGPNLYGVVGSDVASVEEFNYSPAMADEGGEWTPEHLNAFLENPREAVPGTRMSYRGIRDLQDRANMIAYLNSMSDAPVELGAAAGDGEAAGESAEAPAPEQDFGQLVVAPGVEETWYACTACHSEMIVAQQGKTREGWDEMLVWMVEEQGMAELPEAEREVILDYLAAHYNTDRPNFPRP